MAEALYLVTRSAAVGGPMVNGVFAMVINKDDGQTNDQIIADAIAQANAQADNDAGAEFAPFYSVDAEGDGANYFDTVTKISDLSAGPLKDNKDAYVFDIFAGVQKVEG